MENLVQKFGYFLFEDKGKTIGMVVGCGAIAILVSFLAAAFVVVAFLNI